MPDQSVDTAAAAAAPAPEAQFELTLTEWCRDHSRTNKQVELLGAFFRAETAAGRTSAMKSTFDHRFDTFANAPA